MGFLKRLFGGGSKPTHVAPVAPQPTLAKAHQQTEESEPAIPVAERSLTPTQLCQLLYFQDAKSRDKAFRIIVTNFGSLIFHIERRNARLKAMYKYWIVIGNLLREDVGNYDAILESAGCPVREYQSVDYRMVLADSDQCDADSVKALATAGADVDAKGKDGNTALIEAVKDVAPDKVKALIAAGANVNAKGNGGNTALIWAASKGDVSSVRALIAAGADVNARSDDGSTALIAASTCDVNCVRALIAAGADVNARGYKGGTALVDAAYLGDVSCVKALIAAGADVNAKSDSGEIPLAMARRSGRHDNVAALIAVGATELNSQQVALAPASEASAAGVGIGAKAKPEEATLVKAVKEGDSRKVRDLIAAGADVNVKNNDGDPIIISSIYRPDCLMVLIAAGADVNAKDSGGSTALIYAAYWGKSDIVKTLIAAGADVNAKDNRGDTALSEAASRRHSQSIQGRSTAAADACIEALIAAGAEGKETI